MFVMLVHPGVVRIAAPLRPVAEGLKAIMGVVGVSPQMREGERCFRKYQNRDTAVACYPQHRGPRL